MTTVVPIGDPAHLSHVQRVFASVSGLVRLAAGRLPGQYTVSKLDALEQFQRRTSRWQVAAILLLTPLPFAVINLLLELVPLADPAAGFAASGAFQVRQFVSAFLSSVSPNLAKRACWKGFPVRSATAIVGLSAFMALVCVVNNMVISLATGVFPVPFALFTPVVAMGFAEKLVLCRRLRHDRTFREQNGKLDVRLGVENIPLLVYPAFTAAFMSLTPREQLWFSLLLPAIKLAVRRLLWVIAKHDRDLMGVVTCGAGHLYHVLFTVMCLQNSKSLETLAAVVLFNTGQMLANCWDIVSDAAKLRTAQAQLRDDSCDVSLDRGVCAAALTCAEEGEVSRALHQRFPSVLLSTYPGYQRAKFVQLHRAILKPRVARRVSAPSTVQNNYTDERRWEKSLWTDLRLSSVDKGWEPDCRASQILPWSGELQRTENRSPPRKERARTLSSMMHARSISVPFAWAVREETTVPTSAREAFALSLVTALHQTEIILLKSYITICATAFYMIYLAVVFWLPNHRFFATQDSMTTFDAVCSVVVRLLVLCSLEIVFFAVYLVLMWRHLAVAGTQQLAFVLWSQQACMQSKFLLVPVNILAFPLAHYGNDLIWNK